MPSAVKKAKSSPSQNQPADPGILIKGYGSLKGQLPLPDDIDWTKPIYEQVLTRDKRRAGRVSGKRRLSAKKAQPDVAA
jgi:hypothetical protein